jgi:hypothetical protein
MASVSPTAGSAAEPAVRSAGFPPRGQAQGGLPSPLQAKVQALSTQELAQALVERLTLAEGNWHRQKSNRALRAQEQVAAALVYLLKGNREEALPRLEQAVSWLNRSISAPPCPDHGDR